MTQDELKFRAWDMDVQGWLFFGIEGIPKEKENIIDYTIVHQFVGLFDKNGKEIYDGDIVKMQGESKSGHFRTFQGVVTDHGFSGYTIDFGNDYMEFGLKNYEYEIIGNIYEHPIEAKKIYKYS